jgi:excisionase family DNA binding protein
MITDNARIIDMTVEELKIILKENISDSSFLLKEKQDEDEIGGMELARQVTKLSFKTIYQLTSQRKIPFFKKGKILYFSRSELEQWIKSGKQTTMQDIADKAAAYSYKMK